MKHVLRFLMLLIFMPALLRAQAVLISQFDFTQNYQDVMGNSTCNTFPSMTGGLFGGNYVWEAFPSSMNTPGGGVQVWIPDAALTETNYSVAITFSFNRVDGYRKIMDFNERGDDAGFYVNDQLRLYSIGNYGPTNIADSTWYTMLFVRDGSNDSAYTYLLQAGNVLSRESVAHDAQQDFVPKLIGAERLIGFFHDDTATTNEYTPSGGVSQIRIWNGLANVQSVARPEPQTAAFLLYPNPASGHVYLNLPTPWTGEMEVMDAAGRIVYQQHLEQAVEAAADLSALPAGMYLVRAGGGMKRLVVE